MRRHLSFESCIRCYLTSTQVRMASFGWWMNRVKTIFTLALTSFPSTFPLLSQGRLHAPPDGHLR